MAFEWLLVLSYLKPGVDAWKVASGAVHEENTAFDPKLEMTYSKGVELATESIPGSILQCYALLRGGGRGKVTEKVVSIAISAFTTGMCSASISYDFDSDPEQRRKNPAFYGKKGTSLALAHTHLPPLQATSRTTATRGRSCTWPWS